MIIAVFNVSCDTMQPACPLNHGEARPTWAISGKYLNSDGDLKEADDSASCTADGLEIDIDEEAP